MKIIKRNGSEEVFDINKIIKAVKKADINSEERSLSDGQIEDIAEYVEFKCNKLNRAVSVEEIQDMVENQIMATGAFELAKSYVRYRYKRSLVRKANTTDNRILSLIEYNNEDVKQENSNKNPAVNSVQRDYMAGEVSRDLTTRMLLPEDIVEADRQGIIHFHDSDYFAHTHFLLWFNSCFLCYSRFYCKFSFFFFCNTLGQYPDSNSDNHADNTYYYVSEYISCNTV